MKKRVFLLITALFSLFVMFAPLTAYADTSAKQVQVPFYVEVSNTFSQFEVVNIVLFDENYEQYVVGDREWQEQEEFSALLPAGHTYHLVDIYFSDSSNYAPQHVGNISYKMEPFTVNKDGTILGLDEDGYVSVRADFRTYNLLEVRLTTAINVGREFDGIVNLTYYNDTDAYYTGRDVTDEDGTHQFVFHATNSGNTVTANVYTGNAFISNVYAYTKDKIPLNVYYPTKKMDIPRSNNYKDITSTTQIFVFANEDELTEEELAYIKNPDNGYVLKSASQMDPFTEIAIEKIPIYQGEALADTFPVYANDIPFPYKGWNTYRNAPSGAEAIVSSTPIDASPDIVKVPKEENSKPKESPITIVLVVITIVFAAIIILVSFLKRANMSEVENEENSEDSKSESEE